MAIDYKKVCRLVVVITIPSIAVYLDAGEALRVSEKPSEYIGMIFSLLAASLFATVSIVGDPGNLMRGSWRKAWEDAKDIQLRLMRLTYLFILYLFVLFLLVFSEVVEAKNMTDFYVIHDLFAWFAILAFLWSLWLPFEIKNIQVSRLDTEITNRKSGNG